MMTGGLRIAERRRHEAHGIQSACGTSGGKSHFFGETLGLSSPNSNSKKKEKNPTLVTHEMDPCGLPH